MPTTQGIILTSGAGNVLVPPDVSAAWVTMIGGGGGGSSWATIFPASGGGGGSGEYCRNVFLKVTPGGSIPYVVGAGGIAAIGMNKGGKGGTTSLGSLRCEGGYGGLCINNQTTNGCFVGAGGNGGGVGGLRAGVACQSTGGNQNSVGRIGVREGRHFFGGSGGGSGGAGGEAAGNPGWGGYAGGGSEGRMFGGGGGPGGRIDDFSGVNGGGGGGASPWGPGGNGGTGVLGDPQEPLVYAQRVGKPPPAWAYGAGGGGAASGLALPTGTVRAIPGASGAGGYIEIEWIY